MTRLFTYKMTVDDGTAPNPLGSVCTLAICKPQIRKSAEVGDWVVGFGSKAMKTEGKILCAMKISLKLTFEQYNLYCQKLCRVKLPNINKYGDCIYYKENGEYKQRVNNAHTKECMERDLGGKYVLLADEFYYFGKNCLTLPKYLKKIIPKQQAYHSKKNKDYIYDFKKWIRQFDQGVLGRRPYQKLITNKCILQKRNCKIYKC